MSKSIIITLSGGLGANLGPNFNLTADIGTVVPVTSTKTQLLLGQLATVDDTATSVTITSVGTCTNSITLTMPATTTTTTTGCVTTNSLRYSSTQYTACSASESPVDMNNLNLATSTKLYIHNSSCLVTAANGYYSDGTIVRYWDSGVETLGVAANCAVVPPDPPVSTTTTTPSPTTTTTTTPYSGPVWFCLKNDSTYSTNLLACAGPSGSDYLYSKTDLTTSPVLYTDTNMSTPFVGNGDFYKLQFLTSFYAARISNVGQVSDLYSCPATTTTTTTGCIEASLSYSETSWTGACFVSSPTTIDMNNTSLSLSSKLYINGSNCSVTAPIGFYSDGLYVRYWDSNNQELGEVFNCNG